MNFFLERYNKLGHEINVMKIYSKLDSFQTIRINTLKISEKNLIARLKSKNVALEKIDFADYGYKAKACFSLGSTPEYLQGYYYLQEAASQVPVQILMSEEVLKISKKENINKKCELVLDMCASPGGKTTYIAQLMNNTGTVVALDINKNKLISLRNNIARLGIKNTIVYNMDAAKVARLGLKFDKILLDAPCSGNFTLENNWLEKRKQKDLVKVAETQKKLLKAAFAVLKKDGIIVYSTCSLEPEEDEEAVNYAVDKLGAKLIDIEETRYKIAFNKDLHGTLKFWPDVTNTQGFFVAKLAKK
ncbi:RsmB/NOP family class I SAM-dependent RNA methyltransferase [Candidatus Woesearchaeota archaeon]|nr:RsmB/NOP family class I SAM-dependent RNA methyltransferase [Candidatus Woesearchaeota archaeon]